MDNGSFVYKIYLHVIYNVHHIFVYIKLFGLETYIILPVGYRTTWSGWNQCAIDIEVFFYMTLTITP